MWASIVAWFKNFIGSILFDSIITRVVAYIRALIKDVDDRKEVAKTVENDMAKTEGLGENPTRQEQIDAADDALRNL